MEPIEVDRLDDARDDATDREGLPSCSVQRANVPLEVGVTSTTTPTVYCFFASSISSSVVPRSATETTPFRKEFAETTRAGVMELLHNSTDGDAFGELRLERRDVDLAQLDTVCLVSLLRRLALVDEPQHDRCGDLLPELDKLCACIDAV